MLYDFLLPTETRRNYEAKPPLRGSPLATKGSPRLVSFYSWVMFCLDFVCMLVMFQTTGHPSEVTDFLGDRSHSPGHQRQNEGAMEGLLRVGSIA